MGFGGFMVVNFFSTEEKTTPFQLGNPFSFTKTGFVKKSRYVFSC